MMKRKKTKLLSLLIIALSTYFVPDVLIKVSTQKQLFNTINNIPSNKVGLLLGTSKYLKSGRLNFYYKYRIDAAVELYKSGKIKFLLISGDNGQIEYNEPQTIKNDLIKRGIPSNIIYLDHAGFRTWDSIIRAKKVFGESKLTVISQKFHNERAIFIGKCNKMDVIGYNAKDLQGKNGLKTKVREKFARNKLFIDILVNKQPRYLGSTIEIK